MGRAISREGGGGGVPNSSGGPNITQTAPTTAEVSQSEAANADADTEANRLLKIKKRGRSQSIMTGSKGVTKTSTDYSLGKKSLLGRV
jgi:cobyric acid synthase